MSSKNDGMFASNIGQYNNSKYHMDDFEKDVESASKITVDGPAIDLKSRSLGPHHEPKNIEEDDQFDLDFSENGSSEKDSNTINYGREGSDNNPIIKINSMAEEESKNCNNVNYANDSIEEPVSVTTEFRSSILKSIYQYIDSTEISIQDQ